MAVWKAVGGCTHLVLEREGALLAVPRLPYFTNLPCKDAERLTDARMTIGLKNDKYRLIAVAMLACIAAIYVYPLALPTPLLDPDEGLHASISQEMAESGDYVVPRLLGEPFLDKPILYFAAQAISLKTFGMSEAAVRLPGLLFALLGVATTILLASRLLGRSTGIMAGLVALTLVVPLALAQAAAHDIALVPWTNLLLLCWWEADRTNSSRVRLLLTLGASLLVALALLTKGLIGVAVVSVGYVLFVLLSQKVSWRLLARFATCLFLGGALASPWFLAMEHTVPGYLWYYFIERHFSGFVSTGQQHGSSHWYYYLPILLGGSMPWVLYMGPGLWQTWLDRRQDERRQDAKAVLFVLCWLVGGSLFLSVAGSKLVTYALPLFPAIAVLAGHSLKRFLEHELTAKVDLTFVRIFQLVCVGACVLPIACLAYVDHTMGVSSPSLAYVLALLTGATGVAAIYGVHLNRRHTAVAVGSLWFSLAFVCMMTWPLQRMSTQYSQKPLGTQFAAMAELPDKVTLVGDRIASLIFYLTPQQRQELQPGQIIAVSADEVEQWAVLPEESIFVVSERELARTHNSVVKHLADAGTPQGGYRIASRSLVRSGHKEKKVW